MVGNKDVNFQQISFFWRLVFCPFKLNAIQSQKQQKKNQMHFSLEYAMKTNAHDLVRFNPGIHDLYVFKHLFSVLLLRQSSEISSYSEFRSCSFFFVFVCLCSIKEWICKNKIVQISQFLVKENHYCLPQLWLKFPKYFTLGLFINTGTFQQSSEITRMNLN